MKTRRRIAAWSVTFVVGAALVACPQALAATAIKHCGQTVGIENLTGNFSRKIWQKISIVESFSVVPRPPS